MIVTCSKPEAARRQLDEAIAMLFADRDPLPIRTLVAAAHTILSDLVEIQSAGSSWRTALVESSGLSRKEAIAVLNVANNYLKHADRDPDDVLTFSENETDHVIFFATLECCELGQPLSTEMQAFQIWYLAAYPEQLGEDTEPVRKSKSAFNELHKLERQAQLAEGLRFLHEMLGRYGVAASQEVPPE